MSPPERSSWQLEAACCLSWSRTSSRREQRALLLLSIPQQSEPGLLCSCSPFCRVYPWVLTFGAQQREGGVPGTWVCLPPGASTRAVPPGMAVGRDTVTELARASPGSCSAAHTLAPTVALPETLLCWCWHLPSLPLPGFPLWLLCCV